MQRYKPFPQQKRSHAAQRVVFALFCIAACIAAGWFLFRTTITTHKERIVPVYSDVASLALWSKRALMSRVVELETTLASYDARLSELALLTEENNALKAQLGRTPLLQGTLAHVLTLPNRSFYDTITIDAGRSEGIREEQTAYAFGEIALGTISSVSEHSATVLLLSAPQRQSAGTAVGTNVAVTLIGRGSGEYEVRMPRDVHFEVGNQIAYQSVDAVIVATVERIVTDPRDPFQRLLAKAPVNLQALKWVVVK